MTHSFPTGYTLVGGPLDIDLAPNQSATFQVRLDNTIPGVKSGEIIIDTNDLDENPFNFAITGEVPAVAEISVTDQFSLAAIPDGGSIDLGQVDLGTFGPLGGFQVANVGTDTLTLGSVTLPSDFLVATQLGSSVAPGGPASTFTFHVDASTVGLKQGWLSFPNNDSDENPFDILLHAEVLDPATAEIEIHDIASGATLLDGNTIPIDFGTVVWRKDGPERTFSVENLGFYPLQLPSLVAPTGFLVTDPLAATIQPGESDDFTLKLDSDLVGVHQDDVVITNNDVDESPFNFAITGEVLGAPEIQLTTDNGQTDIVHSVTDIAFGTRLLGQTASEAVRCDKRRDRRSSHLAGYSARWFHRHDTAWPNQSGAWAIGLVHPDNRYAKPGIAVGRCHIG